VATLAADGQTNRDIAQALYVTPKRSRFTSQMRTGS
jgi:DNA-binding CsgD family transcriptional regulator